MKEKNKIKKKRKKKLKETKEECAKITQISKPKRKEDERVLKRIWVHARMSEARLESIV